MTPKSGVSRAMVFEPLPSTLPRTQRREWVDDHLHEILSYLEENGGVQQSPCRIREFEMSYQNATSCSSHINTGYHGEGWLAKWELDPEVDPIKNPQDHAEFAHYSVYVIRDEMYLGDRTGFPPTRVREGSIA